jgi:hypothetical protein
LAPRKAICACAPKAAPQAIRNSRFLSQITRLG